MKVTVKGCCENQEFRLAQKVQWKYVEEKLRPKKQKHKVLREVTTTPYPIFYP